MKPHYRRTADGQTVMVHDGYQNAVANIGTARDKQSFGGYVHVERSPHELLMAYRSAWLPRKIVDIPAMDATRRWRSWNAEKDQITAIEAVEKRLALQRKVRDAMISARLYGGAAIYVSTARGNPEKPADPERDGPVRHLTVIPKSLLAGDHSQWQFDSLNFGLPEFYRIAGKDQRIHHSRLVRFVGSPLPISGTEFTDGWGDSVLEAMFEAILQSDGTAANIASLVYESKVDIIYIPRLMEMVANREGEQAVQNYLRAAMAAKGVNGALILDGGDTSKPERNSGGIRYDSKTQAFSGLDSVWDRFLQAVSGAADIPTTRLLGQSPAGMNATGESDLRNYYDRVQAMQSLDIAPAMELLDQAIVMEATGKPQDEIYYDWRSLWQTTESERAALGKSAAEIITSLKATELWPDEVLASAGGNALIESGALPGFEAALDEWVDGADDETVEPNLNRPPERTAPGLRLVQDRAGKSWETQPRQPKGSPNGGQWSGGHSASLYGPQRPAGSAEAKASTATGGGSSAGNQAGGAALMSSKLREKSWDELNVIPDEDYEGGEAESRRIAKTAAEGFRKSGLAPAEVLDAMTGNGALGEPSSTSLSFMHHPDYGPGLQVVATGEHGKLMRFIGANEHGLTKVLHESFVLNPEAQGQGIAKKILGDSMAMYQKGGVKSVHLEANISAGGYAWAKFGFLPDDWGSLRGEIASKAVASGSRTQIESLRHAGAAKDSLWKIADSPGGKELLSGTHWVGSLDLSDPEAMQRFNRYVK